MTLQFRIFIGVFALFALTSGKGFSQSIQGSFTPTVSPNVYVYSYDNGILIVGPTWTVPSDLGTVTTSYNVGTTYYAEVLWSAAGSGYIRLVGSQDGYQDQQTVTVTNCATSPSPVTDSFARCGPGTLALQATPGSGGNSIKWYEYSTGGYALATGTSYTTSNYSSSGATYYFTTYNTSTGCESSPRVSYSITINSLPAQPSIVSAGSVCGSGQVTLTGTTPSGVIVWYANTTSGTISNGALAQGFTYSPTVSSTTVFFMGTYHPTTYCETAPGDRQAITATVNPLPTKYTMTGGGPICSGGNSLTVSLSGSQTGVNYQLKFNGSTNVGSLVAGTGGVLNWTGQTTLGTYTVTATNTSTGCSTDMNGSSSIYTGPAPATFSMTGGGSYCSGGPTVTVSLSGSETGVNYQLKFNGSTNVGSPVAGTGGVLSWTGQTALGTYTVTAKNATTACTQDMSGSSSVYAGSPPSAPGVSGNYRFAAGALTLSASGGSGTYNWYNPSNALLYTGSNYSTPSISSSTSNYAYVTFTNTGNCVSAPTWVNITIYPLPVITSSGTYVAMGSQVTLDAGAGYDSYLWKNSANTTVGSSQTLITGVPDKYTVTVTKSGATGTSNQTTIVSQMSGQNQNYMVTNVMLHALSDTSRIQLLPVDSVSQTISYADGLGRFVQTVVTQGSPSRQDIVQPKVYDAFGRERFKYLPYTSGSNGWFKTDPVGAASGNYAASPQYGFYNNGTADKIIDDTRPFAETVFEASPLNRPTQDFGPGQNWKDNNKLVAHDYPLNKNGTSSGMEQIIAWEITSNLPVRSTASNAMVTGGYYTSGQLMIKSTVDEEGHEVREYVNREGQTILKKVQAVTSPVLNSYTDWTQTYYVYDYLGNLRYVLQPELVKLLVQNNSNPTTTDLANFAFIYRYDARNRMTTKKVPGADSVYMVYDKRNRVVMTQDGNQRPNKQWLITKYDSLNRPVITALYTYGTVVSQLVMSTQISSNRFCEYYMGSGASVNHGYSSQVWPTSGFTVLTVTYYDNYNFVSDLSLGAAYAFVSNDISRQETTINTRTIGRATGAKVSVLDGLGNYLYSVSYYDGNSRVIQAISQNNKSGWDRITNVFDFTGRLMNTKTIHHTSTHSDQSVAYRFTYDHTGRRLKTYHNLNNGANEMLLSQNKYNELGQVIDKNLHLLYDPQDGQTGTVAADNMVKTQYDGEATLIARSSITFKPGFTVTASSTPFRAAITSVTAAQAEANGRYFQSVDYRYNIRGWLTSMNNSQLTNDGVMNDDTGDLFGMQLGYNTSLGSGNTAMYNGKISAMKWSSNLALGTVKDVAYNYSYDVLNQITAATYLKNNAGVWSNTTGAFSESGYQYDMNGNIKNLVRHGAIGATAPMDNLTYTYNGNQLLYVTDAGDAGKGFADGNTSGNDYGYDVNGNMVTDKNKSLNAADAIQYNYLNLPVQVQKSTGEKITYFYNAVGNKLAQRVYNASNVLVKTTEYNGAFIYQGDTLQFINHEEGRIVMKNASPPEYQYHLKDHLGNVRLTFTTISLAPQEVATYEEVNKVSETTKFVRYDNARRINASIFDHTNGASPGFSERLNGSANEKYGLAKSISVMPGDKINAEVYAKYVDTNSSNWTSTLATLMSQISANTTGVVYEGLNYASSTSSFPAGFATLQNTSDSGAPRAYLNWLVFDRNYAFITGGFKQISTAGKEAGSDVAHEYIASPDITITQAGYVYIYLSNENPTLVEVYFDDFKVTHTKSPIVQQDEYYAFGLQTANSWTRENVVGNNFLFNEGSELNITTGLYDLDFRNYDPVLGRMNQIDPLADHYTGITPYNYSFNSPVMFNDPMGLEPRWGLYTRDEWAGNSDRDNSGGNWVKETTYYKTTYYCASCENESGGMGLTYQRYSWEAEYKYVEAQSINKSLILDFTGNFDDSAAKENGWDIRHARNLEDALGKIGQYKNLGFKITKLVIHSHGAGGKQVHLGSDNLDMEYYAWRKLNPKVKLMNQLLAEIESGSIVVFTGCNAGKGLAALVSTNIRCDINAYMNTDYTMGPKIDHGKTFYFNTYYLGGGRKESTWMHLQSGIQGYSVSINSGGGITIKK